MFVLRAEEHHLGVVVGTDGVSRRPIEHVAGLDDLLGVIGVGHRDLAFEYVTPVRALAEVALQAFEKRFYVRPGTQREILPADLSVPRSISEIDLLSGCCAGYVDLGGCRFYSFAYCTS